MYSLHNQKNKYSYFLRIIEIINKRIELALKKKIRCFLWLIGVKYRTQRFLSEPICLPTPGIQPVVSLWHFRVSSPPTSKEAGNRVTEIQRYRVETRRNIKPCKCVSFHIILCQTFLTGEENNVLKEEKSRGTWGLSG